MVEYSPIIKPFCENIILTFINWLGLDVKRAVTLRDLEAYAKEGDN